MVPLVQVSVKGGVVAMDSKLSRVKLTTVVVGDNSRFCRSKIQEVTVTEVGTLLSLLLNGHFAKTYLDYFQTVFMGDACFDRASLHKVTFAKVGSLLRCKCWLQPGSLVFVA